MKLKIWIGTLAAGMLLLAGTASATTTTSCTGTAKVSTSKLVEGVGLTPEQVRAARARLSQLGGNNYQGLAGLGLTPAQIATIQQRIKVSTNTHPAGWPCAPFQNRVRVISFVRAKLVYNGFRPAMQFFVVSPRQVRFNAILDGIQYYGVVVKTGPREITVSVDSTRFNGGGSDSHAYTLNFDA